MKTNGRMLRPDVTKDGLAFCTVRAQRNYGVSIEWFRKRKDQFLEPLRTGHNHAVEEKQSKSNSNANLFAKKELHLRYKYNFDYIKETFDCKVNQAEDTVVCSSEYKCVGQYSAAGMGLPSFAFVSISYTYGKYLPRYLAICTNV